MARSLRKRNKSTLRKKRVSKQRLSKKKYSSLRKSVKKQRRKYRKRTPKKTKEILSGGVGALVAAAAAARLAARAPPPPRAIACGPGQEPNKNRTGCVTAGVGDDKGDNIDQPIVPEEPTALSASGLGLEPEPEAAAAASVSLLGLEPEPEAEAVAAAAAAAEAQAQAEEDEGPALSASSASELGLEPEPEQMPQTPTSSVIPPVVPKKEGQDTATGPVKGSKRAFDCEYNCGFSGPYDTVEQHEKTCSRNPTLAGFVSPLEVDSDPTNRLYTGIELSFAKETVVRIEDELNKLKLKDSLDPVWIASKAAKEAELVAAKEELDKIMKNIPESVQIKERVVDSEDVIPPRDTGDDEIKERVVDSEDVIPPRDTGDDEIIEDIPSTSIDSDIKEKFKPVLENFNLYLIDSICRYLLNFGIPKDENDKIKDEINKIYDMIMDCVFVTDFFDALGKSNVKPTGKKQFVTIYKEPSNKSPMAVGRSNLIFNELNEKIYDDDYKPKGTIIRYVMKKIEEEGHIALVAQPGGSINSKDFK